MSDEYIISEVEFEENSIRPTILNFENGTIQKGQEDDLTCQVYKDKSNNVIVAAATPKMLYKGVTGKNDLYNNFIAIRNRKSNKMRLIAVDCTTLSPFLEDQNSEKKTIISNKVISTSDLNKQFGSKKAKRLTEQRERMKSNIETVKEDLLKTVTDIKIDASDIAMPSVEESDGTYRPKINRSASTLEDVYILNDIVSSQVLTSLAEECNRILQADDEDFGKVAFVTQEIKKLKTSQSNDLELKCQLLLYIDCLIKYIGAPAKAISSKKYQACSYSDIVSKDIIQKFSITSDRGRLRPTALRDKCLCYILVLSMLVCNYKISLEILGKDTKTSIKKLQEVSRVLAFSVSKDLAVLKLPLPAPVSNAKRGKKKK